MADLITIKQWLKWFLGIQGAMALCGLFIFIRTASELQHGGNEQAYLLAFTVTCALAIVWCITLLFYLSARRMLDINSLVARLSSATARLYWGLLFIAFIGLLGYVGYQIYSMRGDTFALLSQNRLHELEQRINNTPSLLKKVDPFSGETLLDTAFESGSTEAVEMLLDQGASFPESDHGSLFSVCMVRDDIAMLETLIAQGFDPNKLGARGVPPLHYAVCRQKTEALKILLDAGASVNAEDRDGRTVLMRAMETKNTELVSLLINHEELRINQQDTRGNTALHAAVRCGQLDNLDLLLKHGAQALIRNKAGMTPLHLAALGGKRALLPPLLKVDGLIELCSTEDCTALDYALKGKKYGTAQLLIKHGANMNRMTKVGQTLLHQLIDSGDYRSATFLIQQGANIDLPNEAGATVRDQILTRRIDRLLSYVETKDEDDFFAIP